MKIAQYSKFALALALLTTVSGAAFADGNAFTPLNFDDTSYSTPATPAATKTQNPVSKAVSKMVPVKNSTPNAPEMLNAVPGENPIGNDNIQNAILELDNAQVGIRNELLDYKAKYADVDAQFKLVKNERNMLHKQVVQTEKRIKNIDKAKDRIRKNML